MGSGQLSRSLRFHSPLYLRARHRKNAPREIFELVEIALGVLGGTRGVIGSHRKRGYADVRPKSTLYQ